MKMTLTELFDGCSPEELDELLPDEFDTSVPEDAMARARAKTLAKISPQPTVKRRSRHRQWLRVAIAACLVLVVGATGVAYAAEVKEYNAAVQFFDENGLSTDGLSREDVKAVYRDITTQRFTYDKTAEVIERSVAGVEIFQREPTPEELAALWNHNIMNKNLPESGISYSVRIEERLDAELGFDVFDRSYLDCYQDSQLIWSVEFTQFYGNEYAVASGGLAVWGYTPTWSSEQPHYAWLSRVDDQGKILWEKQMDHGFDHEYIAAVLDNGDGTWAVISRGDLKYLCLSQYSDSGEELSFHQTEVGNKGILNAARLGDGYLVQLGHKLDGEMAHLVKLDREGSITDHFIYEGDDCYYTLVDMVEYNGRVYLSAYATPKLANEKDPGSRYEIDNILEGIFDQGRLDISSEKLTPMVRDNYTAVLLVCDPKGGVPETFYSIKGSLGQELSVDGKGELIWNVESVMTTEFSLATSAYSIRGTCQVFQYTFDITGVLVQQEDTGETTAYFR